MGVIGGEEVAQKMDENEGKLSDGCSTWLTPNLGHYVYTAH